MPFALLACFAVGGLRGTCPEASLRTQAPHVRLRFYRTITWVCAPSLPQALALLPSDSTWRGSPGLLTWEHVGETLARDSVHHVGGSKPSICPRASVCSEGPLEIVILAVARTSAYSLYAAVAVAFLSKCYCSLHWMRSTVVSLYFPLQWTHSLHRLSGVWFMYGSIVHTIAHIIRWSLRDEMYERLFTTTGISGVLGLLFLLAAVLPMFMSICTKWIEQPRRFRPSFEARHWMHLLVCPMLVVLMWHQTNLTIFCICLLVVYSLDRAYMVLCKTCACQTPNPTPSPALEHPSNDEAPSRGAASLAPATPPVLKRASLRHHLAHSCLQRSPGPPPSYSTLSRISSVALGSCIDRVEEVTFMRLDDGSVQMQWKNPNSSTRPKPGEYVRVLVPAINNEFRECSTAHRTRSQAHTGARHTAALSGASSQKFQMRFPVLLSQTRFQSLTTSPLSTCSSTPQAR